MPGNFTVSTAGTTVNPSGHAADTAPDVATRVALKDFGAPVSHTSQWDPPKKVLTTRPCAPPAAGVTTMPALVVKDRVRALATEVVQRLGLDWPVKQFKAPRLAPK